MHPTLVREPFHRDGWAFAEKYDGWRMLALKEGHHRVQLVSRNAVDHTERFRELADAMAALKGGFLNRGQSRRPMRLCQRPAHPVSGTP